MTTPEAITRELAELSLTQRTIKEADAWYGPVLDVTVTLPSSTTASFWVHGPYRAYETIQPASVNWSALGSVSGEDAAAFAAALAYCALLSEQMEGPVAS